MGEYTTPAAIIAMLIAIGGLGLKRIWVFGWYFEETCNALKKQLEEKDARIDRLLDIMDKSSQSEAMIAEHIKGIKPAERLVWEGGKEVRRRSSARQQKQEEG